MKINYEQLPEHIQGGMRRYVEEGIEPGSFCMAALSNDLVGAYGVADDLNTIRMHDIARWLYNDCPAGARGSTERVQKWMERGGLKGQVEGYDE